MLEQNANIFNTCLSAVLHLRSKAKAQSKFKLPQVIKHTDTLLSNITINILDAQTKCQYIQYLFISSFALKIKSQSSIQVQTTTSN